MSVENEGGGLFLVLCGGGTVPRGPQRASVYGFLKSSYRSHASIRRVQSPSNGSGNCGIFRLDNVLGVSGEGDR